VSETVGVMLVDDQKTMLAVIATHLNGSNLEVVATAPSGEEELAKFQRHKPTLLLLDMARFEMTGSETLQTLLEVDKLSAL
jgi:CheY-like chemotaxis protein